jgi:Bacterial Ig-like domain (group 3)
VRWRLVHLLALLLVVSIVAGCYRYGSTAQSPSSSVSAEPSFTSHMGGYVIVGKPLVYTIHLGGGQSPTGTITFKIYGPDATPNDNTDNCSGTPVYTDTVNVDFGNGDYNADPFTPTSVGNYFLVASYSGDSNNQAATSACEPIEVADPREETTAYQEETTAYQEETTSPLKKGELASPPDSTLSYGGREVRVSVSASYCWSSAEGSFCADGVSTIPPRKQTLHVPSGSKMVFRYEAPRPPKKVSVSAASFDEGLFMGEPAGSHRSLKAYGSGVEKKVKWQTSFVWTIPAELPPGEYGVYVYVTDPQGDPHYVFRVMVE